MRAPVRVFLIVFLAVQIGGGRVLTKVEELRELGLAGAEMNYPVKLKGVVTYYSEQTGHAFLWDGTGSIFFHAGGHDDPLHLTFEAGELIEIEGVTVRGRYSPSVGGSAKEEGKARPSPVRVKRLGWGELPEPELISSKDLFSGRYHDQYVKIEATIRKVTRGSFKGKQHLHLLLSGPQGLGGWQIEGRVEVSSSDGTEDWVGEVAQLSGVVTGTGDELGRSIVSSFQVPTEAGVLVRRGRVEDAYANEALPIREVFRFDERVRRSESDFLHVEGVVTYVREGLGFYLGSEKVGLWVQTPVTEGVERGLRLSVVGMPSRTVKAGFLQDSRFKILGKGTLPEPVSLTLGEGRARSFHGAMVEMEGKLIELMERPGRLWCLLRSADQTFQVDLPLIDEEPGGWRVGSLIRVKGVCELPLGEVLQDSPQLLVVRVAAWEDVEVVEVASIWTAEWIGRLVVALVVSVFLGFLLVGYLQRRVNRQADIIAEQALARSVGEERQRIARELHDTLEQQLAGVQLHLDAVSDWLPEESLEVGEAVKSARDMLVHSRTEARRSVFELRSPALEKLGVVGAIKNTVTQLPSEEKERVQVVVEGEVRPMRRLYEFQILRIVQEALHNALKHGNPDLVKVVFNYHPDELEVSVQDDGVGFDSSSRIPSGHFGILGMRERAGKVRGKIDIESSAGKGTRVTLSVPLSPGESKV